MKTKRHSRSGQKHRANLNPRRMTHEESAQRRADIYSLIKKGWSTQRICKKFGVSFALINQVCNEYGLDPKRTLLKKKPLPSDLNILFQYINSPTVISAAKELGITPARIGRVVRRAKVLGICDASDIRKKFKKAK